MRWERTCAAALCKELETQVEGTVSASKTEYQLLQDAAVDISRGKNEEGRCIEMLALMETSHSKMSHASATNELNELRQFYTDSCILRGLAQSVLSLPLQAVATLDLAIIIAGAYGVGRLELIMDTITRMQSDILQDESFKMPLLPPQAKPYLSYSVRTTIPCLSPPSFLSFQSTFSSAPFVLRNYAQSWPAFTDHPWRSASYLRSVAGPGRVVPVEVGADYRLAEWKQDIISWDVFLSSLDFEDCPRSTTNPNILYLAQHDLMKQFPSLRDDILVPDYVYASLTAPECPGYQPPLEGVLFNTWLGPEGTISPAHTDPFYNFYVQVVGHKSVWLAPPSISSSMYPYPSRSTETGHGPDQTLQDFKLGNTSQVGVFSDVDELQDFPNFTRDVVPISRIATLGPGDVLFFPPGWWHAMKSESTSFSLSMWF